MQIAIAPEMVKYLPFIANQNVWKETLRSFADLFLLSLRSPLEY